MKKYFKPDDEWFEYEESEGPTYVHVKIIHKAQKELSFQNNQLTVPLENQERQNMKNGLCHRRIRKTEALSSIKKIKS